MAAPPQIRREEAEAALLELEVEKLAGEIARQPVEQRLLEAEAADLEASRYRGDVFLIVFLLMTVLVLALAVIDPKALGEIGRALPWKVY